MNFKLASPYKPAGDQLEAIRALQTLCIPISLGARRDHGLQQNYHH